MISVNLVAELNFQKSDSNSRFPLAIIFMMMLKANVLVGTCRQWLMKLSLEALIRLRYRNFFINAEGKFYVFMYSTYAVVLYSIQVSGIWGSSWMNFLELVEEY